MTKAVGLWSAAGMGNVLNEERRLQVLALGRLGWSLRRIESETGVRRETAGAYLHAAGIQVRRRGGRPGAWPPKPATTETVSTDSAPTKPATGGATSSDGTLAKPATTEEVSTDSAPRQWPPVPGRAPSASACEPYRELVVEAVARGRNAMAIWQDLVDDHGFRAGYASVKRYVARLREAEPPEARVVIVTAPGEEAQVDYGEGPMVRDRGTGKYKRTRLFVLTLGHSRKSVRLLAWKSSSRIWAELHEQSFRRLGGVPRVIVLDNLREGVITPDVYDPTLNPLYRDVLAHYEAVAIPCRVRDPDRKGKVESSVGHAQRTPLRGMRFESIEEAQTYLDRWETNWADTRIHGTTKRQVTVMFAEGEAAPAGAARRAVSVLPVRRADGAPRRLRRGRRRVLRRAAGMDRSPCAGAVGRRSCAARRSADRRAAARAPQASARSPSHLR